MPSRYLIRNFKPKRYYHIFNRGGFKQKIFLKNKDYEVFLEILKYYLLYPGIKPLSRLSEKIFKQAKTKKPPKPYELIAYCLMPNHYHLLLRQNAASPTLTELMRKLNVTYAM